MRALACVIIALVPTIAILGCMPVQLPGEKLNDSANDVVMATRFGRMDLVVSQVQADKRDAYMEAHKEWGGKVRILDIEYGGARIVAPEKAVVLMTVAWQRIDESTLRNTMLKQTWSLAEQTGWKIVKEEIAGGDVGLIKEDVVDMDMTAPAGTTKAAKNQQPMAQPMTVSGVPVRE
jgi:hypothetical protein